MEWNLQTSQPEEKHQKLSYGHKLYRKLSRSRRRRRRAPPPLITMCTKKSKTLLQSVLQRVPKVICTINNFGCTFCGKGQCLNIRGPYEVPHRTTRSMSRLINETENIIIYENYRCMPLLGTENETVPEWEAHVASYTVVFCKKSEL